MAPRRGRYLSMAGWARPLVAGLVLGTLLVPASTGFLSASPAGAMPHWCVVGRAAAPCAGVPTAADDAVPAPSNGGGSQTATAGGPGTAAPATVAGTTTPGGPASVVPGDEPEAALTLVKTALTQGYSAAGQTLTYDYQVTDSGTTTIDDLSIDDDKIVPADLTCPPGTLSPGSSVTCTGAYTTTQADVVAGAVTNTATASGLDPCGCTVTSNPSTATVEVQQPAMTITKSVDATIGAPGDTVTYTVTVANTGAVAYGSAGVPEAAFGDSFEGLRGDASYVEGSATATSGSVSASSQGLTWSGALAVGATSTVTYEVRVTSPDPGPHLLENTVVSHSPGSNCSSPQAVPACSTRTPIADMTVDKQVCGSQSAPACGAQGTGPWESVATVPLGGTAYWRITATNIGTVALTGVTLSDPQATACAAAAGTFSLPVGGSVTVYCSTPALDQAMTNVVTATYPQPGGPPPAQPVTTPPATASVTVADPAAAPALAPGAPAVGPAVTG